MAEVSAASSNYYCSAPAPTYYDQEAYHSSSHITADSSQVVDVSSRPTSSSSAALGGAFSFVPAACDCYGISLLGDYTEEDDGFDMAEVEVSDAPEVGDEIIPDEAEETCERTCEPGPCSDILNVPDDYPTIYNAMEVAQRGDIVNLAPGTYTLDHTVEMGECTHLQGAGADRTTVMQFPCYDEPGLDWSIEMAEDSSLSGINFSFADEEGGGCGILIEDASAQVEDCTMNSYRNIMVRGASYANIQNNVFSGGYLEIEVADESVAEVTDNVFSDYTYAFIARDDAAVTLRRNNFTYSDNMYAISTDDNARIDLGRADDPGLNIFYNSNLDFGPDCGDFIPWRIYNHTSNTTDARGNYFDDEAAFCPPGIVTFEEMAAHPDPFDPSSNITHIIDGHDEGCELSTGDPCGIVDYQDFRPVSDSE